MAERLPQFAKLLSATSIYKFAIRNPPKRQFAKLDDVWLKWLVAENLPEAIILKISKKSLKRRFAKKLSETTMCKIWEKICKHTLPIIQDDLFNWPSLVQYQNEKRQTSQPKALSDEGNHGRAAPFGSLALFRTEYLKSPCTLIPGRGLLNANCVYYLRHKHLNLSILLLSPPHGSLRSHVLAHSHYSTLSFPLGDFFPEIFKCKLIDWSMCHLSRRISFCFSFIKDEKSLLGRLNSRSSSGNGIT